MSLQSVTPLPCAKRPGESDTAFERRKRQRDAIDALNASFAERKALLLREDAYTLGLQYGRSDGHAEGYDVGVKDGHREGYWWGFVCGGCLATVGGMLAVIGWAWLHRGVGL